MSIQSLSLPAPFPWVGARSSTSTVQHTTSTTPDMHALRRCQGRVDGISPDDFGLRWFAEPDEVCLYGARDVDIPYDHFVRAVDIIDIHRHVLRGAPMSIARVDHTRDEHRIWTHTPYTEDAPVEEGYLALRRRPDGGVRVAMLTRREVPEPTIHPDTWGWLRTWLSVKVFRGHFRRTIGTVESLYTGPHLQVSH